MNYPMTYSMVDVLMASPTEPLDKHKRTYQLSRMWEGLAALESGADVSPDHWRSVSDAVNLMETLAEMGSVRDESGLLTDAVIALGAAGERAMRGQPLRLDAAGIHAARAVLEDYAAVLEALPARTVIQAHRRTEIRIRDLLSGRARRAGDSIVAL